MAIDFLIRSAVIVDGTGSDSSPREADVAIKEDRIVAVGDCSDLTAERTINASGLCLCPGFIDVHAHSDFTLLADGRAQGKIAQGITTEVNGNCGLSAAPLYGEALDHRESELRELGIRERWQDFEEYFSLLREKKIALNVISLVGHGNLRASSMGYWDRPASAEEMQRMKELLGNALASGAGGLSTGLIYPPGMYAATEELVELARQTAASDGLYTSHMRSEGDALLEAVDEVIRIARESGVRAHISHLKTSGRRNWRKLNDVVRKIDALSEKERLTWDRYPYIASSTDLDTVLPSWAFEGGREKELKRLTEDREHLARDIKNTHNDVVWSEIVVSSVNSPGNKWMEGKSIQSLCESLNKEPLTCLFDLLLEEELRVGAIFFSMNEENLRVILKHPSAMIGTDSSARSFKGVTAGGVPHPRGFGSCPRVLGKYVRLEKVMTLNEAVWKMTSLPARVFRVRERGTIAAGCYADIVVFDPHEVMDLADFGNPFQRPRGIHHVFVNGRPVVFDGEFTDQLPGRILI